MLYSLHRHSDPATFCDTTTMMKCGMRRVCLSLLIFSAIAVGSQQESSLLARAESDIIGSNDAARSSSAIPRQLPVAAQPPYLGARVMSYKSSKFSSSTLTGPVHRSFKGTKSAGEMSGGCNDGSGVHCIGGMGLRRQIQQQHQQHNILAKISSPRSYYKIPKGTKISIRGSADDEMERDLKSSKGGYGKGKGKGYGYYGKGKGKGKGRFHRRVRSIYFD